MNLRKLKDDVSAPFEKVDASHYNFIKEGKPAYTLTKKDKHWECTCPAYKFHQKCKHADLLEAELKKDEAPDPAHQRHPRAEMERFIPELEQICAPFKKWEIVGSWRRKSPTFKDVDVIAIADPQDWKQVHQNLVDSGAWEEFIFGDTLMRGMYHGYYLDFNLCPSEDVWLWWLLYRTGSADENTALRSRAISMGYAISEKGVQDRYTFEYYANEQIHSEEEFYNFFGYEYRPPEKRDGKNFKQLPDWNIEEHYSEGKKQVMYGDIDWEDYLLSTIDKVKGTNTVYSSAKYPARLAIVVARELARRNGVTPEFILSHVDPDEIQPDGFKKGQQSWDTDGNIVTIK